MGNQHYWTEERRQEQRERINRVQPWLKSTGATTVDGKAIVSRNAYKGGLQAQMRELIKQSNELLKEHNDLLKQIR